MSEIRSKLPLWEHQQRAFWFAYPRQAAMLALDMGVGKSAVAVALCVNRNHRRILITCPLSVVPVWSREFARHSPIDFALLPLDARWSTARKAEEARKFLRLAETLRQPAVVVVNHESLWREPFGEFVLKAGFDFAIIDESHRAKQYNGKLGRYVFDLGRHVPYRLCLTGTPFPHSPLDIFAQYRFLDSSIFGTRYHPFKLRYAVQGGYQGKEDITDPTDRRLREDERRKLIVAHKELNEKFFTIAIRITKQEALDLPEEVHTERTCELDPLARQIYRDLERDFYAAADAGEITAANALVKLLRLQQVTSGAVTLDDGVLQRVGEHKHRLLTDVLEDLREPVVVFCRFTQDLDAVKAIAERLGRTYGEISGRQKDLTNIGTMPEGIDVMGAQYQAGGVGVDLTRASTVIYYSPTHNLADYLQSKARVHRPGQQRRVTYIHLKAEKTIDDLVYSALQKRVDVIASILEARRSVAASLSHHRGGQEGQALAS